MSTQLAVTNGHAAPQEAALLPRIMESVLMLGDLSKLSAGQRVSYYGAVCESLDLNPLTKPFDYLFLNGKLTLYATKCCAEQLRARDGISLRIVAREVIEGIYVVTAAASTPAGRADESTGAVPIEKLAGEARANAYMKAETKAKRRVTLSICGLGMLDESELDSIAGARRAPVDLATGEISDEPPAGSQTAADAVAQRKIAELREQGAAQFGPMLRSLREITAEIGEEAAAVILGNHGYESLEQVQDIAAGRRIYGECLGYSRSLRQPRKQ